MSELEGLGPADIAALVAGYARLGHSPGPVLFDALAARAAERGRDFYAGQRQQVSSGLRQLGYASKDPFSGAG